jgi:hypothetical protein
VKRRPLDDVDDDVDDADDTSDIVHREKRQNPGTRSSSAAQAEGKEVCFTNTKETEDKPARCMTFSTESCPTIFGLG